MIIIPQDQTPDNNFNTKHFELITKLLLKRKFLTPKLYDFQLFKDLDML